MRPMKLQDYTTQDGFLPHLECATLDQAVARLVDGLPDLAVNGPRAGLVGDILRREAEGSTAIGGGLLIPHARSLGARRLGIVVATLARPLDVAAADGRPVDVVILLVGPPGDPVPMLRLLARLARLVRQPAFLEALRTATTPAQLEALFAAAAAAAP